LRSSEICLRRVEVPGQQFLDAIDRVIGDLLQDVAQVTAGVVGGILLLVIAAAAALPAMRAAQVDPVETLRAE
jgi:ABC-type lipoprotein release transport system permease subunit